MPNFLFVLRVLLLFLLLWVLFSFSLKIGAKRKIRNRCVNREGKKNFKCQRGHLIDIK
jgi:hypothetical protein